MLRSWKSPIDLTLMILLLILLSGSVVADVPEVPGDPTLEAVLPDSMQIVPKSLLREATRTIDQQDLRIMLLENRLAERDSVLVSRETEWQERLHYWQEYAEQTQVSTWEVIWPALLVLLGVAAGRI